MNNRKIAFITCVSDERKYAECRHYLDRLHIPEGYNVDVISIQEASSMAAGYNAGMESSDAKYKIYLHQDVFIHNVSFISDLLAVFDGNEQIGLMGMIGNRERSNSAPCKWDTGKTVDCYGIHDYGVPLRENVFEEVCAADGLLLATQYDIAWREDLFDGWHFYDTSQCMEFKKAGYKVAVPWQEEAWCCHDTMYPALGVYWKYYELFVQEYREMNDFPFMERTADLHRDDMRRAHAYEEAGLWEAIEKLFEMGGRTELREFFSDSVFRKKVNRKEYQLIVYIDRLEEQNQSLLRFWMSDMTAAQLLMKLQELKYMLKRIECGAVNGQEEIFIQEHYSKYAVIMACNLFIIHKSRIYEKLGEYLAD